jgi:hypothetical protein
MIRDYEIINKKTGKIADKEELKNYIFPIAANPSGSDIKKLANFQKEISEKYYKKIPSEKKDEAYRNTVNNFLSYYKVPNKPKD